MKDVLASAVISSSSLLLLADDAPAVAQTSPNRGGRSWRPSITPLMKSWTGRGTSDLNTADADADDEAASTVGCCRNEITQTSTRNEILGTGYLLDACNMYDQRSARETARRVASLDSPVGGQQSNLLHRACCFKQSARSSLLVAPVGRSYRRVSSCVAQKPAGF